jgi:uncharacterized protein (DUF1684 family)
MWRWRACFAFLTISIVSCSPSTAGLPWADQIAADRAEKDRSFREGPESPLLPERKGPFTGLSYFSIDESYRVPASLAVAPEDARAIVKMPTSTGQMRDMVRVGRLAFTLKGQALQLSAFVEAGEARVDSLFVPFSDLTTGRETYAGGRYLDLTRSPSGVYDLDFNRAYHPYCVYNATYDCPYPPPENRLPVAVRAGERLPS